MDNFDLEAAVLKDIVSILGNLGEIIPMSPVKKGDNPNVNPTTAHIHMNGFEFDLFIVMRPVRK
jgi:hypothetical protein